MSHARKSTQQDLSKKRLNSSSKPDAFTSLDQMSLKEVLGRNKKALKQLPKLSTAAQFYKRGENTT